MLTTRYDLESVYIAHQSEGSASTSHYVLSHQNMAGLAFLWRRMTSDEITYLLDDWILHRDAQLRSGFAWMKRADEIVTGI